jgi:branched-chain amino acid transport system substrate-binding protein
MPQCLLRNKWLVLGVLFAGLLPALAACGGDDEPDTGGGTAAATTAAAGGGENTVTIPEGESIVIGILAVITGDNLQLGEQVRDGATLARDQLGPVQGFDIELVTADDQCMASGAEPAAQQLLAEDNLVAVIGAICSGVNVTIQPTFEEEGITQISPGSTAVNVTYPEGRDPFDTFLRTVVHDGVQGVKQAEYATEVLGATTVYTAHDTDAYGAGLKDVFNPEFEELGGEVLGTEGWEKGQTDFSALVSNVTTANPDLVYVSGFAPEAAAFLRQLRAAGYEGNWLGGDGVITEQFLTDAGEDAEGVHLSKPAPFEDTPELLQFQEDFDAEFGYAWDRAPYGPEAYDAFNAVHKALNEVAVVENGSLVIDLDALNDALHASDFEGLSGQIKFDDHGDKEAVPGKPLIIFSLVEGGAYVDQEFE